MNAKTQTRSVRIASIIEKRKPLAQRIEKVETNLQSLASEMGQLENSRNQLITAANTEPRIADALRQIDFSRINLSIFTELENLKKLKARFNRQNLNLGVVGIARQGKSRLLRSLSGLSSAVIPDGHLGHCTGVCSTIYPNENGDTYAEIGFHTEQSFLKEVIAPYYKELDLGEAPRNMQDFAASLPPLPSSKAGVPTNQAKYDYLVQKYHDNLREYYRLLGQPSLTVNDPEQIRQYVAQDNTSGDRVFFNYLAVKQVTIFCPFPNPDTGKIALVDMPGLGDTGVGAEEQLIKTLGESVDVVLFMRLPKSTGDAWSIYTDIPLYEIAQNALKDRLPIEKWSFMILNRTSASSEKGDNSAQCQFMEETLPNYPIKVINVITADCSNSEEANTKILDRVLDYLTNNIENLDKEYATFCQNGLNQLQIQISSELDKARQIFNQGRATNQGNFAEFRKLFRTLWNNLVPQLIELLDSLRQESDAQEVNTAFQGQVNLAGQACTEDSGIPTIEEIEIMRISPKGQQSYQNTYNIYLNQMRTNLSQKFASIDVGLKELIEQTKSRVTNVLVDAGRLGNITELRGSEFIQFMAENMPDSCNRLKKGFQILSKFDLSYSGLFQHRIRQQLDPVTPDKTDVPLPSDSPTAEDVLERLTVLHQRVVYDCENALSGMSWEPGLAAFGMVEEFIDQVLRSEDVEDEWIDFLEGEKERVWPDIFDPKRPKPGQEWQNLVERATMANQGNLIQFLN
ncbi:hypothetical protein [Kamptonema sp. UHCC 0994]|uniref:hypothetical protein n=1 Tax=Kamptonema sp. UHCC 0994 TaxID=3031329 RepID=UPI0023BABEEA|nr:hypothetical protein [Kamptonema sp. UHCC 0994]MDF0556188.1 hypothetical protein [Kamptonema sp. UHCC 0994]